MLLISSTFFRSDWKTKEYGDLFSETTSYLEFSDSNFIINFNLGHINRSRKASKLLSRTKKH